LHILLYFPGRDFKDMHKAATTMIATDVMTVREVADYLKVKDRTIYRLVANREMPGFKVGGSWRFRKAEIDRWTEANAVGLGEGNKKVVSGR